MKLTYYTKTPNFGDALNPMIFSKYLPEFFDEDEDEVFIGIGSIIHLKPNAKSKIVFSSGYAYGKTPIIDNSYKISCVRGPLTASKLGLDKKFAITDGAALLKTFKFKTEKKKYEYSLMPHHESILFYDWKSICNELNYNYISPLDSVDNILSQILQSKILITEAMHGAIVADTLRVPWIPFKCYKTINEFKWKDWTSSLNIEYNNNHVPPIFSKKMIEQKISFKLQNKLSMGIKLSSKGYKVYQDIFIKPPFIKKLNQLKNSDSYLSKESVLNEKVNLLIDRLEHLKKHKRTF